MSSRLIQSARALHIALVLVFPLVLLMIVGFTPAATFFSYGSWFDTAAYWIYWLMAMPIFAVYGGIAAVRFFPTKTRDIVLLFVPTVGGLVASFLFDGTEQVLATSTTQAAVFYIGVYALLILGLLPLVVVVFLDAVRGKSRAELVGQLIARAVVLLLILAPIIFTMVYAHNVGRAALVQVDDSAWRIWFFYGQMVFIAGSYFPRFRQLLREGRL